uniref:Uncharacterized protein n=1 Tax=Romanomermis culicivorax TaxID=13658 RepID=A0A915HEG7_ROMCU
MDTKNNDFRILLINNTSNGIRLQGNELVEKSKIKSEEKEKLKQKQEGNDEEIGKELQVSNECMAVTRAMMKQMLEPETQETFINLPPPTQQEID